MALVTNKMSETLQDRVELCVMGWIRLFIENQVGYIPIECKLVCKDFFGALIDTKILTMKEENLLLQYIKEHTTKHWNWKLIYRGSTDGYEKSDFVKYCENKENTVIVVHNEHNHVFGGYTPCPWKINKESSNQIKYGKDESCTTFLFVLRTKFEHGPQSFKLKKDKMDKAVSYRYDQTAFDFGCNDFYLYERRVYTWKNDCCFEWNGIDDKIYMCGKEYYSNPEEIEIFQLY